ncbi:aminoglycoside phosphotransferase family protein [Aurantibacter crassamenti]|uniref:phosphotransferase enzyme family protein n=1 Tax=Aurantibacter crassamenti TaxID=1837375 RepID=UPI00193A9972|nr:aminoglycoside phosphotransferase family protein [Aurantibacter crassamenti]MBM1105641.1 aminoglycoside phosphotransferase family protein [Aurantibacter crassamenti]
MSNFTDNILIGLLANFSIANKEYTFKPLTDGFINDTFLVLTDDKPLYILQRVNHLVFKNIDGLMNNIHNALENLDDVDYHKITLVKTQDGKSFYENNEDDKAYWRLMTYINESTTYNTTENQEIAFEAGRVIGKFHVLLNDIKVDNYIDTIPRFHDLELRKSQFEEALQNAQQHKKEVAAIDIDFAIETLSKLSAMRQVELPTRICHNDTKLNNILFSQKDSKALCLIDLDTIMKGKFHYDFGDAVRTIVNTAPEDEQQHDKITFKKSLFESFVSGIASNGAFLSKEEIDALPYGAILLPFLHGLRALTDYLNNNIYYKVAYENQNLDRSRSLFDFTKKAINNLDFMKEVTTEKLLS